MSETTSTPAHADAKPLQQALREIAVLADLPEDHIAWLANHSQEIWSEPGEIIFKQGRVADTLVFVLEGEVNIQREDIPDAPLFIARAGQVTGKLPFSRMVTFGGTARAVTCARGAMIHESLFPEMLTVAPELAQRLVAVMADRIRESTKLDVQREKLMALGKLSAGLAHELNNPAAAIGRSAAALRETLDALRFAGLRVSHHTLSNEQTKFIDDFEQDFLNRLAATRIPDPVEDSDREERISAWLESHGVKDGWELAPLLSEAQTEIPQLETGYQQLGGAAFPDVISRVVRRLTAYRLLNEIENGSKRVSELVRSIKEYSYMDQAPEQEVDVHQGLESTLTMMNHVLKHGIEVVRDYDTSLPPICARGSELNQVWTNLIDNAAAAMKGKGQLGIRTSRENDRVLVEIRDSGPGIPQAIQSRIFEPFFTTKPMGEGTGLGLDSVRRIISSHHGDIHVESKPGDTRFQIRLPISRPRLQAPVE
ncbi:MAG: ATP-binding protein [Candidatus Acidiferrales bacterium]